MLASTGNLVAIVGMYRGVGDLDDPAGHIETTAREQDADSRAHADGFGGGQGWYLVAGVSAPCLVAYSRRAVLGQFWSGHFTGPGPGG